MSFLILPLVASLAAAPTTTTAEFCSQQARCDAANARQRQAKFTVGDVKPTTGRMPT